jgi:hypothetical protein
MPLKITLAGLLPILSQFAERVSVPPQALQVRGLSFANDFDPVYKP